ncbi:gamma-glutamyltransferase family protein [Segniliparus rugosus]|uniref:Gamma-glutamyltransferase n=1 Tax=Segniliparus rugosus (strain ATCC BAA-974 / DSM 45345 / CCUG 50838 / CIP 108380 / JCM 13579 / CDC 945) TaxID=679197 RepID=E5XLB3_SEGRC|nr:gamma-glutamyltransferase family protein [Segniliparus rugosus]EFV14863.1 gamma-glutamyltransferase [Segniliparus rugosus ATCC BAA-974]
MKPLLVALLLLSGCVGCSPKAPAQLPSCADISPGTLLRKSGAASGGDIASHPEHANGYRTGMRAVDTRGYMVITANPLASKAACETLSAGGTAADALVAAQAVLGLAEPQSSGIGGGAFLLYYDAAKRVLEAYDGRETAPAAATGDYLRWISGSDRTGPKPSARASGRAIGVPGVLRLLELAHREHGAKPWRTLFDSAVSLADNGFPISPRMADVLAPEAANLRLDPEASAYLLHPDGSPKAAGELVTNPAYAKTLGAIADEGADAFYTGAIADDIVASVGSTAGGRTPGLMTLADLAGYRAKKREPVCAGYRGNQVCEMPGPSSGGIAVAQTLGILSHFDLRALRPAGDGGGRPDARAVHLVAEAERLAYADRDKYLADPDFVPPPGGSPAKLLDPAYLAARARLVDPGRSMGLAAAGDFGPVDFAVAPGHEHGTSQITVVDSLGNAASMTTTIESAFGSYHMVDGFFLNNQLTDFSAQPADDAGRPVANCVQPGKRPRSSMSPTLVFGAGGPRSGDLQDALGSPGGSTIIQYVVKTLVALLDWGLDPQQAVGMADFGASNSPTTSLGGEHPLVDPADGGARDPLVAALRRLGHTVDVEPQDSGLSAIRRVASGWEGGADPRREGVVMGDKEHVG